MPKMKTNRGAVKRFRTTGKGAVKYRRAFRNHILTKKSTKMKRQARALQLLKKCDQKSADRLLGHK